MFTLCIFLIYATRLIVFSLKKKNGLFKDYKYYFFFLDIKLSSIWRHHDVAMTSNWCQYFLQNYAKCPTFSLRLSSLFSSKLTSSVNHCPRVLSTNKVNNFIATWSIYVYFIYGSVYVLACLLSSYCLFV